MILRERPDCTAGLTREPEPMPYLLSRRAFFSLAAGFASMAGLGGYSFAYEPRSGPRITSYAPEISGWPAGLSLRIAALTDIHVGGFAMPPERLERVVAQTNALEPDIILLLGDYVMGWDRRHNALAVVAAMLLRELSAPLGVHAILGNHDWWDVPEAQHRHDGPVPCQLALEKVGIPVMENSAVKLLHQGHPFWLLGLGDMLAFDRGGWRQRHDSGGGRDDLHGTVAQVEDDGAPAILMAHEPDVFPHVPERVGLTLSGHTHGGQVRLFGWSPIVPSQYGNRYAYGHVIEGNRHLIVSGGLGTATLPVRLGMPPEIVLITLGQQKALA